MTKIISFATDKKSFIPIELELSLWPGLPSIQFIGLPDQHVKESAARIKSAIKSAGFEFPRAQQILVNLRPSHLKKNSKGLDLAVAIAFLIESGQIENQFSDVAVYAELGLQGQVIEPEGLLDLPSRSKTLMTGPNLSSEARPFERWMIQDLSEVIQKKEKWMISSADHKFAEAIRPQIEANQKWSRLQAELISLLAVGGHSALFAGAAGSGKTSLAKALIHFLRPPTSNEFLELKKIHRCFGVDLLWRPMVKPHHSTPLMAMVGGGSVPFAGEISRAHGGLLILDELLEFSSTVQESLREPFEEKKMRVFRAGHLVEYPANAQIVGTTNLCPCGDWTPAMKNPNCRFSMTKCRSYSARLSGPLVDRFQVLVFFERMGKLEVSADQLLKQIIKAQKFSDLRKMDLSGSEFQEEEFLINNLSGPSKLVFETEVFLSQRRRIALLQVARTFADLDQSSLIETEHLKKATLWTIQSFEQLKKWC